MTMSDHDALVQLHHRYGAAVRAGADAGAEAWAATWLEDGHWELPNRTVDGIEEILSVWRASMARTKRVVQMYLSTAFDVDGDVATGQVQLMELVSMADDSRSILAGHYDDTYRRAPDGWRFASRALTIYYRGAADLSGNFP